MNLQWFFSRTARHAGHLHKHVHKLLSAQRDILSAQAIAAISEAMEQLQQAISHKSDTKALEGRMANLENVANKWLKPYPNPGLRENVEVFLVAIAVAMAIRTFFLQPFKIPTGSMQPTLYGITYENLIDRPDVAIPNALSGFFQFWLTGISYKEAVAPADGQLLIELPTRFLLFNLFQKYSVGGVGGRVWFPEDKLFSEARLGNGMQLKKGEVFLRTKMISGDHLFVDRFTFNFRRPRRGEVIVFETKGIDLLETQKWGISRDQYYIKRLVGLGGEQIHIGGDHHLIIDGKRLDASTPGFSKVYGAPANSGVSAYDGHTQVEKFANESKEFEVRPKHYLVMGDNTRSSLDSRYFGDFSREYVIGKAAFVYWPFTQRFFFGYKSGE
jgi:signal peptidase I